MQTGASLFRLPYIKVTDWLAQKTFARYIWVQAIGQVFMESMIVISQGKDGVQRSGKAFASALLGLCVFVAVLATVTFSLRQRLRAQICARDAAVLHSVTLFELEKAASYASGFYGMGVAGEYLLDALLDVSRLDGVVAFRVFDTSGNLLDAAPSFFIGGGLSAEDLAKMGTMQPLGRFHRHAALGEYFVSSLIREGEGPPLLEVLVPLHKRGGDKLIGVGQFLLDGTPTLAAFAELDRNLITQAGLALLAALILGGGLTGWAFWNLHRGNQLLYARTRELVRANRELALRSRVSAIGAVTANLLHGLKNPLAALSMYVEERRRAGAAEEGLDDAGEAARRMARMIEDSISILAQEEGGERFDYALGEIADVVMARCGPLAARNGVKIVSEGCPELTLDNRRGNLLALAAVNLVQNAVQASKVGQEVRMEWGLRGDGAVSLLVCDNGPGLPEHMLGDPFLPVRSSKPGCSGVGLAIAAQLVKQMEAELKLEKSGPEGTEFSILFRCSEQS